jgi:hypothetical protein
MMRALAIVTAIAVPALTSCTQTPPAARAAQIATLEARADLLEDASDIKRLQRAYGFYFDQGDWREIADLFAADASAEYGSDGIYVGRARIHEYLRRLGGGHEGLVEGQMHNRLVLQPVVHVAPDGRTAKGRWRTVLMLGQFGKSASWGEGTYENEYVKVNGVWKIAKLHWFEGFIAPYEGGWAKMADAKSLAFIPPYHYSLDRAALATPANVTPALAPLALAVSRLEAHHAIENLQAMYGYYLDKNQWDAVASLFTDDATYEVEQRGVYKGRKRIREALNLIGPDGAQPGVLNNELQLQPIIHVSRDGRSAKARWRTLEMKGQHGKSGQWGSGVHENEYALEQGVWKISKLHYYVTFRADYDRGWLNDPLPMQQASAALPPDAPPTEVYGSLPEVYVPRYHYPNPGTQPAAPEDFGAASPDLRPLAKKIGLLNDEIEVQQLQRAYGYYVDKNRWDEVSALFADGATLEIGGRGVFVGRKRINEYLHYLSRGGLQRGALYDHSQWQLVTHVADNGSTAKQRLRAFIMAGIPDAASSGLESSVFGECTYENEYVKVNGVWKISKLYAYFNMYTPSAEGWGRRAVPNTKPEERLPPDRPPTRIYETYPAPARLEYHYGAVP